MQVDWKGLRVTMRQRTKKEFKDYNEYQDRPFGLKWGPAFALSELVQVITKAKSSALRKVDELPMMTRREIDTILQNAFLKSKEVSIQQSDRDSNGILQDSIQGKFMGLADEECLYIEDIAIAWDSIRNIKIIND